METYEKEQQKKENARRLAAYAEKAAALAALKKEAGKGENSDLI